MRTFVVTAAVRAVLLSASLGVMALAVAHCWAFALSRSGIDFLHFWAVPSAVRSGITDVYSPAGRQALKRHVAERAAAMPSRHLLLVKQYWAEMKPTGSPLLYATLAPFAGNDYEADYGRFQACSLLLAGTGLLLIAVLLRIPLAPFCLAIAAGLLAFVPVLADVASANVNRIMLFPIALHALLRAAAGRYMDPKIAAAGSGFVLVFSILFKPIFVFAPLTLGINRLVRGQYREAAAEVAGGAAAVLVAVLLTLSVFGSLAVWPVWLENFPSMIDAPRPTLAQGNLAPRVWLQGLVGSAALPLIAAIAAAILLAQFLLMTPHGSRAVARDGNDELRADAAALGLALALYIWLSQLTWSHYYTLALPSIVLVFDDSWRRRRMFLAVLGGLTIAGLQLGTEAVGAVLAVVPLTIALLLTLRPAPARAIPTRALC